LIRLNELVFGWAERSISYGAYLEYTMFIARSRSVVAVNAQSCIKLSNQII